MNNPLSLILAATLSVAPTVLPPDGSNASYHYVFTGHFWNGALVQADRIDTLKTNAGTVVISKQDTLSSKTTESHGTIGADGTVTTPDASESSDPFTAYNTLVLLIHGVSSYTAGTKWTVSLPIHTGQHATDITQVPVSATITKVDGDSVTIAASGTKSAMVTYGGYTNMVDLTIQVAAQFSGGSLQRADYKATDDVHAGPLSQELHWTWSLAAQ